MKILYLCADRGISLEKHNGATAHFRSLVRAFTGLGHELLVLTPSAGDVQAGVRTARIPTTPMLHDMMAEAEQPVPRAEREAQRRRKRVVHALGHIWNNIEVERVVEQHVREFEPDFVFELYAPYGVAGALTCNRLGVRHVLNVHAPLAWEGATFRAQALQDAAELLEQSALAAARRIVCNSRQMRDRLVDAGVDGDRIDVVINGVDLELFSPDGETRRAGPPDSVVVGFSGSLKAWHGVAVLCDAFRMAAADPRLHLLIVGDGPLRTLVTELAAELPGRVTITGALPLEDVPPWIRGMDIAVAPYPPLEPFYFSPLKVLDAMATGIANVASDIGQIPELLRDGEMGVLVPPGDAPALAAALGRLADDAALRERLGRSALDEARAQHAWTARAQDIVDIALRSDAVAAR
ncbi:MAG TPA: glycosyltransferase family 4 protein [Longimicrobiales bacterium]|nr:glycosyltransferase family 4 protein [Longimicrobiales bacterium]